MLCDEALLYNRGVLIVSILVLMEYALRPLEKRTEQEKEVSILVLMEYALRRRVQPLRGIPVTQSQSLF